MARACCQDWRRRRRLAQLHRGRSMESKLGYFLNGGPSPARRRLGLVDRTVVRRSGQSFVARRATYPSIRAREPRSDPRFIYDACLGHGRLPPAPRFSREQASQQSFCTGLPNSPCKTSAQVLRDKPHLAVAPPAPFVQESQLGKVSGLSLEASSDGLLRSLQVGQELRCGEVVQLTSGHMRSCAPFRARADH